MFFILRLSRFSRSLSIVNSLIQHLVIPAQISGFQQEVNAVVLFQKRIFHIYGLLEGEPAEMLGIDDHILFLKRYPMQGNLLPLVDAAGMLSRATTATSLPTYSAGTEY